MRINVKTGEHTRQLDAPSELAATNGSVRWNRVSRQSRWLLLYMAERHPTGITTTVPLPCFDYRDKPDVNNLRGLIRRGWVCEATADGMPWSHRIGIFYLTEEGRKRAAELKALNNDSATPVADPKP